MLVQYLNAQSELKQHLMVGLFFLVFIFYSLSPNFDVSFWIVIPLMCCCAVGIYFLLRQQMKNRLVVAIQITEQANRFRVVKKKKEWIFFPFFIYSFLTLIHFYIVYKGSGNIMPLVYDYGLGGVLALAFNVYLFRNWHFSICDDGIIVGSRLDAKLITWEYIEKVEYTPVSLIISINSKHPIHKIELSDFKQVQLFKKLLKYKLS